MSENQLSKYLDIVAETKYQVTFKDNPICHCILGIPHSIQGRATEYVQKLANRSRSMSMPCQYQKKENVVYVKISDKTSDELSSPTIRISNVRDEADYKRPCLKIEEIEVDVDVCSDTSVACFEGSPSHSPAADSLVTYKPNLEIGSGTQFPCRVCYRRFTQLANMVKHERIHTGERPFRCDVCFKSFNQQSNLWKHTKTHTGERPYSCDVCQKTFSQHANLMKHSRIHTGERPFVCVVCTKTFVQRVNLLKHQRTHTGEKPYQCNFCPKSFAQQSNLVKHERIHTGVKPFNCKVCFKAFAQQSNLTKHEAIHADNKPFTCKMCGKSYTQKCNLQKHEKKCQAIKLT